MLNNVFYLYFYTDKFDKLVARQPYMKIHSLRTKALSHDKTTIIIFK